MLFITLPLLSCTNTSSSKPSLDDLQILEKGMTHEQVVDVLGDPTKQIKGSPAFVTYVYELKTGEMAYLGFLAQDDYLDSAYYVASDTEGNLEYVIPDSLDLPSGIERILTFNDFNGVEAGSNYFKDIYNRVGPPNELIMSEGGNFSLIYILSDGGRIGLNTIRGVSCITRIGYSSKSFGGDWKVLSQDNEGKCK
jgi:hypothetical protein